jgi:importin-4
MAIAGLGEVTGSLKEGVVKHTQELFTTFFHAMDDTAEEVQSNAIYGLGLLLESTPRDLSNHYNEVLNKLQAFFRDNAHRNAKDNAVGCVSRMIMKHPQAVPLHIVFISSNEANEGSTSNHTHATFERLR